MNPNSEPQLDLSKLIEQVKQYAMLPGDDQILQGLQVKVASNNGQILLTRGELTLISSLKEHLVAELTQFPGLDFLEIYKFNPGLNYSPLDNIFLTTLVLFCDMDLDIAIKIISHFKRFKVISRTGVIDVSYKTNSGKSPDEVVLTVSLNEA